MVGTQNHIMTKINTVSIALERLTKDKTFQDKLKTGMKRRSLLLDKAQIPSKIIQYVADNPNDSLKKIADEFNVSRQYITKVFKQNNLLNQRAKYTLLKEERAKLILEYRYENVYDTLIQMSKALNISKKVISKTLKEHGAPTTAKSAKKKMIKINCCWCKKPFYRKEQQIKDSQEKGITKAYCSLTCSGKARTGKKFKMSGKPRKPTVHSAEYFEKRRKNPPHYEQYVPMTCDFCGKKYKITLNILNAQKRKGQKNTFCSRSCSASFNNSKNLYAKKKPEISLVMESNIKRLAKIKMATNIGKEIDNYVQKLQKQKVIETTPKHVIKNKKEINSSVVVEKEFDNNIPQPSFKEKVKITNSRSFPEAELTARFKGFMDDRGVELSKLKIGSYENDIYIKEKDILIEAKPDVSSPNFRMVLGQIIHYNYLLEKGIEKPNYVAALFPEKPPDDFIEIFSTSLRYKIYVIWETNKGYFDNNLPEGVL